MFDGEPVEIVWSYKYLGVIFNYNNAFKVALKDRCKLANRAMFSMLRKCRKAHLPLDIQLELFHKCVLPVLLYGCEVWGFEDVTVLLRFQLRFLKMILGVKKSTPSCMIFGETGCYPLDLDIKVRILTFWYNLTFGAASVYSAKISRLVLMLSSRQNEVTEFKFKWLDYVKSVLNDLGLTFLWFNPIYSVNQFKSVVKQRLRDQYLQTWNSDLAGNSICCNYRLFKQDFCFEKYLVTLPYRLRQAVLKFRLSNHKLPVQQLRAQAIPRDERICIMCDLGEIGDEFHYLFNCSTCRIKEARQIYLHKFYQHHPNILKFRSLMNVVKKSALFRLAKFVEVILTVTVHG